ncbi:PRKCA-binding protein [Habropoda laboriosa]|uniref:PRKCA-binding protein n=2 Tax=Habropoda laboriosa TaxID=597456 RepID=A0A0L7QNV3_9HYME|nr:PRKCA-binding protein [Habropoda laboriosa]
MDYDDDFFFEEDKILEDEKILSTDNITLKNFAADFKENFVLLSTVPSVNVQLHQITTMEDRIPDVELVNQDQFLHHLPNSTMGMTITSGNVVIQKDNSNLIGISIGGGAPLCPCLYIVQIFDNTPAAVDGTLQAGDELVAVNGMSVRGKTKVEVAKMIQSCDSQVSINYNKLHADPKQGRTLDIALKKVKHRLVEGMGSATADALGLSRAILCNDALVQRLMALQRTENLYRGLVSHAKSTLHAFFDLIQIYKVFGDAFAAIGVREPQPRASEAFRQFGEQHRQMEKFGITILKTLKPILNDLGTYLHKAIPDTRLTISKYADAKFEYLSYCLKVKELDDEEQSCAALQEPLYRVETGNYEYRLVLRCRQEARAKFAKLRSDVLVKLELLDNKHVQDVVWQLQKFAAGLAKYYSNTRDLLSTVTLFPVEVDLSHSAFQYKSTGPQVITDGEDDEFEPEEKVNTNEDLLIDTQNFPLITSEFNDM